jgi:hypothetical protein
LADFLACLQQTLSSASSFEDTCADQLSKDFEAAYLNQPQESEDLDNKDDKITSKLHLHIPTFPIYLTKSFENYKILENIVLIIVKAALT